MTFERKRGATHKHYGKYQHGQLSKEAQLKRKIEALKRLPSTFRILAPGGPQWNRYYDLVPKAREAMDAWLIGKILYCQTLNAQFIREAAGQPARWVKAETCKCDEQDTLTFTLVYKLMQEALDRECVYIQLMGPVSDSVTKSMNTMCNIFSIPLRFQAEPVYEYQRKGPVGEANE